MPYPATPSYSEKFLGLNDGTSTEIQDFEAARLQNLYVWNRGEELRRRNGTQPFVTDLPNPQLDFLGWYRLETANKLLAVDNRNVLDLLRHTPYLLPGGVNRFTIGEECNGAQIINKVYIGNGLDPNVRVDVSGNVKQLMPSQPPSGTVGSPSGVGTLNGFYTYQITFLSADGIDSEPSVETAIITAVNNSAIALTNIPVAASSENSTGRRIWRNVNGGTVKYLIATINNNTTTVYLDTVTDDLVDTSVVLDTSIVRFPPCKYLVNFQERLAGIFCGTSEGDKKTLYISDYQIPEICRLISPLDEVDDPTFGMRIPIPDEAVGLAVLGNVLIVFCRGTAYRLIGDNPNNWSFDKWIDNGCMSHRTIQVYRNFLFWLGSDGIYLGEGQGSNIQVTRISDPIREEVMAITANGFVNSTGFCWDDRYYICFEDQAYYYDTTYRIWGKLTNWTWGRTTVSRNTGLAKELIYAGQIATGEVWKLESGSDDDGVPIATAWRSKTKDMGQFGRQKRIHRVIVAWKATSGTATVTLYRGAGEFIQTFTKDISIPDRVGGEISSLDSRCGENSRDELFAIQVECDTMSDYRITQAGWLWTLST